MLCKNPMVKLKCPGKNQKPLAKQNLEYPYNKRWSSDRNKALNQAAQVHIRKENLQIPGMKQNRVQDTV